MMLTDVIKLKEGKYHPWDLNCEAGKQYVILGVTEKGVEDLGLHVYDKYGTLVTSDGLSWDKGITATEFNANENTIALIYAENLKSIKRRWCIRCNAGAKS